MHLGKKKFVSACFFRVAKRVWPQITTVTPIAQIVPED
jgi:integral membrane sensor domain MASE1